MKCRQTAEAHITSLQDDKWNTWKYKHEVEIQIPSATKWETLFVHMLVLLVFCKHWCSKDSDKQLDFWGKVFHVLHTQGPNEYTAICNFLNKSMQFSSSDHYSAFQLRALVILQNRPRKAIAKQRPNLSLANIMASEKVTPSATCSKILNVKSIFNQGPDMGKFRPGVSRKVPSPHSQWRNQRCEPGGGEFSEGGPLAIVWAGNN